ncbi:MAG: TonB-dependent receptor plug domain-containing protein [Bacillota bacterium]
MNFKKVIIGILILVLFSMGIIMAWAEEGHDDAGEADEEIVVTATRTAESSEESPGMTETVSGEEVESKKDVPEALRDEGVTVSFYGGDSSAAALQLDGCSAEQTVILLNGVPLSGGCSGIYDLSFFPSDGVERIEIAHGPLSSLHGANALGGALNIFTDLTGEACVKIMKRYGDFSSVQTGFLLQDNEFGIAMGQSSTQGYRNDPATDTYLCGQIDLWTKDENSCSFYLYLLGKNAGIPGSTFYPSNGREHDSSFLGSILGRKKTGGIKWEYSLYRQQSQLNYQDSASVGNHFALREGADLACFYEGKKHTFLTGLHCNRDYYESNVSGIHSMDNTGIFSQDIWKINSRTTAICGVRWDHNDVYGSAWSPRINLIHGLSSDWTVKIGYGKAFRAPTINELYWSQPELGMNGNPELKPENGERWDAVLQYGSGKDSIAIDVFRTDLADGINWEATPPDWFFTPENIQKIRINGVTLQCKRQFNDWLGFTLNSQWLDKKAWDAVDADYTRDMNYYGRRRFALGFDTAWKSWTVDANWQFTGDRYQWGSAVPDYHIYNLYATYKASPNVVFQLAVQNALDEIYEMHQGYPMPGREIRLGWIIKA